MPTTPVSDSASEPRPSSTVVLVREAAGNPEVFMVKRHARSSFGSAYAFPGGVLELSDCAVYDYCAGVTEADANRLLDVSEGGLDYFSAAIRELFEESGVLLGSTSLSMQALTEARGALNDGALDWASFVTANGVQLQCDRLHYFSFWITPAGMPKRYSTRFFLAELPHDQVATHCGGELTDSCWMGAQAILDARKQQTMRVHYPTRKTLVSLLPFESTAALCAWAQQCAKRGVICDQPAFVPEELR